MRDDGKGHAESAGSTVSTESTVSTVQSVDRAVTILELLAQRGTAGVTELSRELGVHKSTASRLVAALEQRDMVEQVEDRGGYRLGVGVVRLAGATSARLDLVQAARPVCRVLAAETGETVNIAVLAGESALYVDQVVAPTAMASYDWVGQHIPLHATSNGKVLLCELPDSEVTAAVGDLAAYTPATITDLPCLREELLRVRAAGSALAVDELDAGLTALAAGVRNAHGEICASVSVSGPSFRFAPDRVDELRPLVVRAADDISARLGWHRPPAPDTRPGAAVGV